MYIFFLRLKNVDRFYRLIISKNSFYENGIVRRNKSRITEWSQSNAWCFDDDPTVSLDGSYE